uniref:Putative ovule protein n=1 Tax=Solanum chacoense TaxID=4108 RepID=A0A0V0HLX3_SOLCH
MFPCTVVFLVNIELSLILILVTGCSLYLEITFIFLWFCIISFPLCFFKFLCRFLPIGNSKIVRWMVHIFFERRKTHL